MPFVDTAKFNLDDILSARRSTTYGGAVVVSPFGQPSLAYVIRNDIDQVSVIDTQSIANVDFAVYYCHTFTGQDAHRDVRKKIVRVYVYGEGAISGEFGSAYMVILADQNRQDVYPFSDQSPYPPEKMLWRQNTMNLQFRTLDICLLLTGTGLVVREVEIQYTIV